MTSKEFVLLRHPNADVMHRPRAMGLTLYCVFADPGARSVELGLGFTASKAWVDAKKNILTKEKGGAK